MRKTYFDLKEMFFVNFLKMLKKIRKACLAACGSFCCEKYFFNLKEMFFVNFHINASTVEKLSLALRGSF